MAFPPVPADEPGFVISQSLRLWLQQLAAAASGLTVTNETITTTRTIIADTFEGEIDGANISGHLDYAQLPSGSGEWVADPTITGAVALGSTLDVSGVATFGADVVPAASESYDLGSETKLWRKAFIGQMQATLFAKETQALYGGWLAVTKNAGTFAAHVPPTATTVDFGQAMTANQFVLVRAMDRTGTISAEHMEVGANVSGTVYNVTRDLDGSGAKDWPEGTPYAVRGVSGDGWIELNAFDTPRLSVFTQGATYDAADENIRIGHLDGMPNSSTGIGAYMGDTDNYVRWDGTDLTVKGSDATLDNSGLTLGSNTSAGYLAGAALKYRRASASGYGSGTGDVFGAYTSSVNAGSQTDTLTIENTMVTPNNGGGFATNVGRALISLVAKGWNTSGAGSAQPTASIDLDSGRAGLAESKATITAQAAVFSGTIAERGRTTPMGEYTTPTFNAGNFAADSGSWTLTSGDVNANQYREVGKSLGWQFDFITTTVSAGVATYLKATLPNGGTISKTTANPVLISDNGGTNQFGMAVAIAGETFLRIYKDATLATVWTGGTNNCRVLGQIEVSLT